MEKKGKQKKPPLHPAKTQRTRTKSPSSRPSPLPMHPGLYVPPSGSPYARKQANQHNSAPHYCGPPQAYAQTHTPPRPNPVSPPGLSQPLTHVSVPSSVTYSSPAHSSVSPTQATDLGRGQVFLER